MRVHEEAAHELVGVEDHRLGFVVGAIIFPAKTHGAVVARQQPAILVPDNTKTAVIKACLYEPQVNRTYAKMATHYGAAIFPARPRRPRDKAKVEQAVLIVERWLMILAWRPGVADLPELESLQGVWAPRARRK